MAELKKIKEQAIAEGDEEKANALVDEFNKNKSIIWTITNNRATAKWGVATFIKKEIVGAAHDITPIKQWGKGRISAVRVITSEGDINVINVYAPAGNKDKKAHYYEKLTEWAQDLKGDLL